MRTILRPRHALGGALTRDPTLPGVKRAVGLLQKRRLRVAQQLTILNSTRRSSASRASSVPVPTMFSWASPRR